jgi:hypothetical protein
MYISRFINYFVVLICRLVVSLPTCDMFDICDLYVFTLGNEHLLMTPSCCFSRLEYQIGHNVSMTHTGMKFVNHRRGR